MKKTDDTKGKHVARSVGKSFRLTDLDVDRIERLRSMLSPLSPLSEGKTVSVALEFLEKNFKNLAR